VIISLAGGLSDLGFIKWMTVKMGGAIHGFGAMGTFILLGLIYIYVHYLFATATGHVAALYAPFAATAIAAGAPPVMVAICYFERPRFYKINLCVVTVNVIVTFAVGLVWWNLLGYY